MKKLLLLSLLLLLYLFSNAQVDLQKGLVAYYPFNGNANDESGNGKHGTLQNTANCSFVTGKYGQAVYLKGGEYYSATTNPQGGYVSLPYFDFNVMKSFSISLWVKENSISCVDGEAYINFGEESNGSSIKIAHYIGSGLSFFVGDSVISQPYTNSSDFVLLTLVYENGIAKAYRNSTLIGTKKATLPTLANGTQAIGKHWWYDGSSTHYSSARLIGAIEDVRIYNRALNYDEVFQLQSPIPSTLSIENTRSLSTYYVSRTQGYSFSISYTLTGTIDNDNQVIAYLSDKNGSFTNPIEIGRINSASSGKISITIPAGMPDGTGYKLVLKTTSPVIDSDESNAFTIVLNDAPTNITLLGDSISENQPIGTVVGKLQTTDPDTNDTFTYTSITNSTNFYIEDNSLKTSRIFDYETEPHIYTFAVKTTDPWGKSYIQTFSISIDNVNEPPTLTLPTQVFSVQTLTDLVLSGFIINDVDVFDKNLQVAVVFQNGMVSSSFSSSEIVYDGNFLGGRAILFTTNLKRANEIINSLIYRPAFSGTAELKIMVNDLGNTGSDGAQRVEKILTINVWKPEITISGAIPTCYISRSQGATFTINYDLKGVYKSDNQFIAYLSDKNGDFTNKTRLNNLVSNTSGIFTVNIPAATPDGSGYTIRLESTNPQVTSNTSQPFTIDLNDAPTNITLSKNDVEENQPIGTTISTLSSLDLDTDDILTYTSLTKDTNFYIEGNTLKTNHLFDYETEPTIYTFAVKVADNHNTFCIQTFNIRIDDVNESPTLTLPSQKISGLETKDIPLNGFSINDIDIFTKNLRVTISTQNGVLRFTDLATTEIVSGSQSSTEIAFESNLSRVNQIINSLIFNGYRYYYGENPITIKVSDLGMTERGGEKSIEKVLKINVVPLPPEIIIQPVAQIKGCVNDVTGFSISADGAQPIEYQWYKDGSILYSEKNSSIRFTINGDEEAGAYYCVAKNLGGGTPSKEGILLVKSQNFRADIANIKLCTGDPEGEISVTATGGWGDYQYSVNNGNTYFQTNVFKKLHVGTYTVVIKDNNNCTTAKDFTVTAPPLLKPNIQTKNIACKDYKNGELNINVLGGTPPFVLDIHSSSINEGLNFDSNTSQKVYKNLIPDIYTITISDKNACDTFAVVRLTEPDKLAFTSTTKEVNCFGEHSGELTFSVSGGTEPYWIYWTNKEMTNLIKNFKSGTYNLSEIAKIDPSLAAGKYEFYITDSQSCYTSENVEIGSPKPLEISFIDNTLIAKGGTLPYQYSENGRSFSTTNTFPNLSTGFHTLTVKDDRGCMNSMNEYIENIIITEKKPIVDFRFVSQCSALNVVGYIKRTNTYSWDFGDGTQISNQDFASHTYAKYGTYKVILTAYNSAGISQIEKTVVIDCQEQTEVATTTESDFTLYPNPATDEVYISTIKDKYLEISIFDASGRKVIVSQNLHISVKDLARGFYVVQVKNEKGISTKKLIIR